MTAARKRRLSTPARRSTRAVSVRAETLEEMTDALREAASDLKDAVAKAVDVIEAFEDIAAFGVIQRSLGEPVYPGAIADRLVAGENPIKVFREHRNLSQSQLAKAAGTSAQYISQIERGHRDPGKKLLPRLAAELSVDEDLLR